MSNFSAPTAAIALILAGITLGGCEIGPPRTWEQNNPIVVTTQTVQMVMAPPALDGTLAAGDDLRMDRFVDTYRNRGEGRFAVTMMGFADDNEAQAQGVAVMEELVARGIHPDYIVLGTEASAEDEAAKAADADNAADAGTGQADASHVAVSQSAAEQPQGKPATPQPPAAAMPPKPRAVVLSFSAYVADPPECGDWSRDPGFTPDNRIMDRFGCSVQRNLGLMVQNPRQLLEPAATDPRLGVRSVDVLNKYGKGDLTAPGEAASVNAK